MSLHTHLAVIEKELQCSICLDSYEEPVYLPCSHQFCEQCIDDSMKIKSECPLCRIPIYKRAIIPNKKLKTIVNAFTEIKKLVKNDITQPEKQNIPLQNVTVKIDNISNAQRISPNKRKRENDDTVRTFKRQKISTKDVYSSSKLLSKIKKPVILCTGLCDNYLETVKDLCDSNGGKIVKQMSKSVTHVISQACTSRMETRRTLKYLQGILNNCWIVGYEWVENSKNGWVDEELYEIKGDTVCGKGGPNKSRISKINLFDSYTFYFYGKFKSPPIKELKYLCKLGGGSIINSLSINTDISPIIIVDNKEYSEKEEEEITNKYPHVKLIISSKWILDSVGNFNMQPYTDYKV